MFHMRPADCSTDTEPHTGEFVPKVIFLHHFWGGSHIIFLNKLKQLLSDGVLKYIKLISFMAQICTVEKWSEKTHQKITYRI